MAIEAISTPAVAYQGGTPAPEITSVAPAAAPATVQTNTNNYPNNDSVSISGEETAGTVPSNDTIKKAVEEINKKANNSEAIFGVHDATNRITIKIVDKESKEVIKEFPPEKTLDMIAKVWEVAGILVDEKR